MKLFKFKLSTTSSSFKLYIEGETEQSAKEKAIAEHGENIDYFCEAWGDDIPTLNEEPLTKYYKVLETILQDESQGSLHKEYDELQTKLNSLVKKCFEVAPSSMVKTSEKKWRNHLKQIERFKNSSITSETSISEVKHSENEFLLKATLNAPKEFSLFIKNICCRFVLTEDNLLFIGDDNLNGWKVKKYSSISNELASQIRKGVMPKELFDPCKKDFIYKDA